MSHLLEIDSIQLQYGQRKILSDVYIRCESGTVVGLLGRNGEGKSSLMKIAFGTTEMEDYSVRIDGQNIKPAFQHPAGISYLPQFNFIPSGMSLQKVFELYNLDFVVFANDLQELKGREKSKIKELSGGIKRMVEIYIIIKKKGMFVMLDEPFTHIMPVYVALICQWINDEKANKGFIISDHLYQAIVSISNSIYLLKDGKTHTCASAKDLIKLGYILRE
ncbi:MAG: ATP-binding cassette domain-containing protein [Chitinophagaceae bacterium]|nr:ATP-binding cassette domain-containing protein [Chitinophagaceae bacterium]